MNNSEKVNVFQGCGRSIITNRRNLSHEWNMFKGKAGNTSPAASLPFGGVACSPYSGGYSAGYGNLRLNCGSRPKKLFKGNKIIGFSHFTHSGTGAIGFYYNYFLSIPLVSKKNPFKLRAIDSESASPGYYSCRLIKENIFCEITVGEKYAIHHYKSNEKRNINCYIDIGNDGLFRNDKRIFDFSDGSEINVYDNGEVGGYCVHQGVKLYFYIKSCNEKDVAEIVIDGGKTVEKHVEITKTKKRYGVKIYSKSTEMFLTVAFSFSSEKRAKETVYKSANFNSTRNDARAEWNKRLDSIEIEGIKREDEEIFYSNFYHSLIKPCFWREESFLWEHEGFCFDFATMWDMYKTQLPLVFTLYNDIGKNIVKTLLKFGEQNDKLFNALLLSDNFSVEVQQACCLGCFVLYDAYRRNLIEDGEILKLMKVTASEIRHYSNDFDNLNVTKKNDLCMACQSMSEIAEELNLQEYKFFFDKFKDKYFETFEENGLLRRDSDYYEGNEWNYSFRFVRDVDERIKIGGGEKNVENQLDKFFAFDCNGKKINRFEGFNNETDMESPYFYHYVNKRQKLETIIKECIDNCFKRGREGLPGNNDSGGLSSCYMWNFLGIFPISGQNSFFLGIPKAKKTTLKLSTGNVLYIEKEGDGDNVSEILFNGNVIYGYKISVDMINAGGKLIFFTK